MSTTHTDLRTAIATVVTGLTVGGYTLAVSDSSDVADMFATELGCHRVAIAVDEAPGDEWGGIRAYVVTLSAGALRGCNESSDSASASARCSTLARALRTAMLAQGALASAGAQITEMIADDITREGDAIVLRQRYPILAPS